MQIRILSHTPEIERLVYTAARTCYSEKTPAEIWENEPDIQRQRDLIRKILESGHHSVLEHAVFTFEISGISRAASHQLVRHRLASYSQQSQRYVIAGKTFPYVVPPSIANKADLRQRYETLMREIHKFYTELIASGINAEDARFILPGGACTNLVATMNARELLHFFSSRCCRRAQWEIREIAWRMLKAVKDVAPLLFETAGPHCITPSGCQEGPNSCGKPFSSEEVQSLLACF